MPVPSRFFEPQLRWNCQSEAEVDPVQAKEQGRRASITLGLLILMWATLAAAADAAPGRQPGVRQALELIANKRTPNIHDRSGPSARPIT
jgi:hypothetical protein